MVTLYANRGHGRGLRTIRPREHIMLRGRHGIGWMILGWAVIVLLIGGGIYLVGSMANLFRG